MAWKLIILDDKKKVGFNHCNTKAVAKYRSEELLKFGIDNVIVEERTDSETAKKTEEKE